MNIEIIDEGTIVLFIPRSKAAREWLESNVEAESWQWIGGSLAVDRRAAQLIVEELRL